MCERVEVVEEPTLRGFTWERLNAVFEYDEVTGDIRNRVTRGHASKAGENAARIEQVKPPDRNPLYYRYVRLDRIKLRAHQLAYFLKTRTVAPRGELDHRNRDGLDNSWTNLRLASLSQQNANRNLPVASSGYRGVNKNRRSKGFQAAIKVHARTIYLGSFMCPHEAAKAYNAAALEHFGEFAVLNEVLF